MNTTQTEPLQAAESVQEPVAIVAVDAFGQIQVGWRKKPQHNDKLYTTPPAQPAPCTWTKSADPHMPDTFDATCGVVWTFTDGGPIENDVRFCPGCGKKVVEDQP